MKRIRGFFNFNPYLQDPEFTQTTVHLQKAFKQLEIPSKDIAVMSGLIQYPKWVKDSDFWQYVNKTYRKEFERNKTQFFVFDASTEGFSTIYGEPYFDILYKMANDYNIDPHRLFFVSSNMKDNDNIIRYNMDHNIKRSINVFTFLNFEQQILGTTGQTEIRIGQPDFNVKESVNLRFKTAIKRTRHKYHHPVFSKVGLSLSRVNRPHRTFSALEIFNSEYYKDMYVSHASLKGMNLDYYLQHQHFSNSGYTY